MPTRTAVNVAFLTIALIGPPAFAVVIREAFGAAPPLATQVWLQAAYVVLALGFVWMAMRRQQLTLSSIGLRRPTPGTAALAAALLVATLLVLPMVTDPLVEWLGPARRDSVVRELAVLPVWFRVAAALTGGAIEETLYRGYAVGRLEALTGRRWLAVAIVVAVFTLSHVPLWGIVFSLIAVLPFSALMTAAYAWRRDLLANTAAHSAGLLMGLLTI
jgi:membrane protease YdiL (CAAX protease family)